MGVTKKKEESRKKWTKVLAVIAGVLFVVLMVVSSLGTGWITGLAGIKPGETAVLDYTIYGAQGDPLITTNTQLYQQSAAQGKVIILGKQIPVTANMTQTQPIFPVQFYTQSTGWSKQYALFNPEYDAISNGIVGMKVNEKKNIIIPSSGGMKQTWTAAQLIRNNVNITDINVGDQLTMGVSDNPEAMASNSSAISYIRMGEVTNKNGEESVDVNFGYPSIDVSVVSITTR